MAVATDTPELRDQLVAKLGLKFPVVSDKDETIIHAFGVQQSECECSLPALYVLDAKDRIRLAQVGDNIVDRATSADIARALAEAATPLAEASPSAPSDGASKATANPTDAPAAPAAGAPKKKSKGKAK